jgi:hypothetical protein
VRIRRAAHDLQRLSVAGIDHADPQPVGIGMLFRRQNLDHLERRVLRRRVFDTFDLEADHRQFRRDLVERGVGVEMLFQPGERELHGLRPPASVGKSSGRKP